MDQIKTSPEDWKLVKDTLPNNGVEVLGYNKSWIDEDVNPDGICVCYLQEEDPSYWIVAQYCMSCDNWHTNYSEEVKEVLGSDWAKMYVAAPTHWKEKPQKPVDLEIIEAYGVYWEFVEKFVDENGWASTKDTGLVDAYYETNTGNKIEFEKHPVRRWRPKMLEHLK